MAEERWNSLLASIAHTIRDYREGDLDPPTVEYVDRWIKQFDEDVRLPMAREIDHVLKKTYFSRTCVRDFLQSIASSERLAGENPGDFWRKANFLRVQQQGNSQAELLDLFDTVLEAEYGLKTAACGVTGG